MRVWLGLGLLVLLTGCASTVTHYDADGRVIRQEKLTNFSRLADGTNQKSQMVLIDGTYFKFEVSATAGDNNTPGVAAKYMNGKSAIINAKDTGKFTGVSSTVDKFFAKELKASGQGVSVK